MAYGESNGHVTLKGQIRDPNTLRAQYLENSWKCYFATITNFLLPSLLYGRLSWLGFLCS